MFYDLYTMTTYIVPTNIDGIAHSGRIETLFIHLTYSA